MEEESNFAKYITGMSRGVVVLDENLVGLEEELRKENIKVIIPRSRMTDDEIKHELLSHRILVVRPETPALLRAGMNGRP